MRIQTGATLRDLLILVSEGKISAEDAAAEIEALRIGFIGDIARIDLGRSVRCGVPEAVLAEGKEIESLVAIAEEYTRNAGRCLVTRVSPAQEEALVTMADASGLSVELNHVARTVVVGNRPRPEPTGGVVGILTAGTADIRVAEEARVVAEEMGCSVLVAYDVGAAGIHRLFPALRDLMAARVLIVAAGREGTLPAVVAGLVDRPVIGVPVSTGYGYMGEGRAALASMLQSCAILCVVNIDAGFTAGAFAARVAGMVTGR